jgi:hypothetical protein
LRQFETFEAFFVDARRRRELASARRPVLLHPTTSTGGDALRLPLVTTILVMLGAYWIMAAAAPTSAE